MGAALAALAPKPGDRAVWGFPTQLCRVSVSVFAEGEPSLLVVTQIALDLVALLFLLDLGLD